jgi:hypothetical protein
MSKFRHSTVVLKHGLNNCKGTKPQMSSLMAFNRVYRLEIQSVMLVFSTGFVDYWSSNMPLTSPLLCVNKYTVYTYTVCKGGGLAL